jgi:hypothetical protein
VTDLLIASLQAALSHRYTESVVGMEVNLLDPDLDCITEDMGPPAIARPPGR